MRGRSLTNELMDRLVRALGPDYRIERELGGGGMSRVFLAEDLHLGRQVVVKLLPPEMSAGVNRDRFQREIQLAARLQHPHIVPLLTAGSRDDLLWYVMPYVEGESLRARLEREVELPVGEAVRLIREATDALAYAHDKGVVHRDIKPDNIMVSSGHALVTDFGVAKAVSEAAAGGSGPLTSLGMALGTPAYMAPEQASADPHVDHRADIYALGATAYELLAGRPPFTGPTPQSIFAAHLTQTAAPLSEVRSAVPAALEIVIGRCLEKRPADRWQKASELLSALDQAVTPSGSIAATTAARPTSGETALALRKSHPVRVALLFGLASLLLLSLAWWLVQRLGLPDWVVTAVGVLLLLGFPVVLIAARRERAHLLARSRGGSPQQPTGLVGRLFTLRGALAGGGIAFSGLAIGIAAFMVLRVMGIGPFATLVSAGVIKPRDRLVLADFENRTADSSLGASITEAFRIDLAQSPVVRLLETRDVRGSLERMMRPPGSRLDAALAQEVAQREGASAVVAGEIAPLAGGFVLSVRLLEPDGDVLLAEREIAADAGEIIGAVERLSKSLREDIGESLRGLRAEEPLEQVSTASLEALRLYSDAERANNAGRGLEAARLLEQALAVDSGFAMAWRKLAVVLGNWGFDPARRTFAVQQAYDLRDRLPRREGALAAAYYFHHSGNRTEAVLAYRQLLAVWPDDGPSRNNLALLLNQERQFVEAESLLQEVVDSGSTLPAHFDNLIDAQLWQRKYDAAESTVARFAERRPEADWARRTFGARVAQVRGDYDRALALVDSNTRSNDPAGIARSLEMAAALSRMTGRLLRAESLERERVAADLKSGQRPPAASALNSEINQALAEMVLSRRADGGRRRLVEALRRYPLDSIPPASRPYGLVAFALVQAGEVNLARTVVEEFRRSAPAGQRGISGDLAWAEGLLAGGEGRHADAIAKLRSAADLWGCPICNLVQIGQAFDRLNQADSALASYQEYALRQIYWPIGQDTDLAPTWIRLGELYEQRGDRARALESYGRFLDMWKRADPELQPRVAEIRRRVGELAGEPKT